MKSTRADILIKGLNSSILAVTLAFAVQAGEPPAFLTGGDISALPKLESLGAVYKDNGQPGDALRIMRNHGCSCFRVRLFVNPTMKEVVVQDLPYAVRLGQRIKATGASLLLDLHYSDTWADPGKQTKPAAWTNLAFNALEKQVESYTAEVMKAFQAARCLPDLVQVGNEITPGILWPDGKIGSPAGGWDKFAALLKAGIRGVRKPLAASDRVQILLHADCGGNAQKTRWFFDALRERQVAFDLIGLSYYPWWHGGLDKLRENLAQTAQLYGKPIIVVETAYPWRTHDEKKNMNWPMTPQGQEQFLRELVETVKALPNGLGRGVIWWYPESVKTPGLTVWKGGDVALFDAEGNALPALGAFAVKRQTEKEKSRK
jgi:arabinogalactan endo-1,4-beta-galactosidase